MTELYRTSAVICTGCDGITPGCRFNSRPAHCRVTTLGKLFTPMCLCRCKWSIVGEYWTRNFHVAGANLPRGPCKKPWSANLLCAQANSASYHQRERKWVVAHGLRGEGLVRWLGQWYVCVLHRGSNCSPSRAMDGRIMGHGIVSSCQSAAASVIVKRCCSSLVSRAITSTQTFTFYRITLGLSEVLASRLLEYLTSKWSPVILGNDTIRYIVYHFQLMFSSTALPVYLATFSLDMYFWRQRIGYNDLEIRITGHSRASKVTPFDILPLVSY